jgi:hypothetical protein
MVMMMVVVVVVTMWRHRAEAQAGAAVEADCTCARARQAMMLVDLRGHRFVLLDSLGGTLKRAQHHAGVLCRWLMVCIGPAVVISLWVLRCDSVRNQDERKRRATSDATALPPLEFAQSSMDEWRGGYSCRSCGHVYESGQRGRSTGVFEEALRRCKDQSRSGAAWVCPGGCGGDVQGYRQCLVGNDRATGQIWSVSVGACPQQMNGHDCGVFMCQYARVVALCPIMVRRRDTRGQHQQAQPQLPQLTTQIPVASERQGSVLASPSAAHQDRRSADHYSNTSIV